MMPEESKQEMYNRYNCMPTHKLQTMRKSLANQKEGIATAQVHVGQIDLILQERKEGGLKGPERDYGRDDQNDQSFDEIVARKYLAKLKNANDRGLSFTLTLGEFKRILSRKTCYYTGMYMSISADSHAGHKLTLERLDGDIGYEPGNVVACCNAANKLRNMLFEAPDSPLRMTPEQFQRLAKAFR